MNLFLFAYPTLAIAGIYCLWQFYYRDRIRHVRILRERVAFMLWTLAQQSGEAQPA
jgi:hypothetical protein